MRQSRTAGRIPGSARRLALTSLGAGLAVAAAAPMASAATVPPASSDIADSAALGSTATSANAIPVTSAAAWSRLSKLKLYPLAGTGVDPLSNVVDTSLGGIPVSTQPVADTFADGLPVADLPIIGTLLGGPLG